MVYLPFVAALNESSRVPPQTYTLFSSQEEKGIAYGSQSFHRHICLDGRVTISFPRSGSNKGNLTPAEELS
jgi:hypothetical protein